MVIMQKSHPLHSKDLIGKEMLARTKSKFLSRFA